MYRLQTGIDIGIVDREAGIIDAAVAADKRAVRSAMVGEVAIKLLHPEARVIERRAAREAFKLERRELVEGWPQCGRVDADSVEGLYQLEDRTG